VTARRDLAASTYAAERAIDRAFAPLAPRMRRIIEQHAVETDAGRRIPAGARVSIMRQVDALLDEVFPKARGGRSRLERLIVEAAAEARMKPIAEAVGVIEQALEDEPEVLERMSDGTRTDD
jgi:hypothetical protein